MAGWLIPVSVTTFLMALVASAAHRGETRSTRAPRKVHTYVISVFQRTTQSTLRFFGPDARLIGERSLPRADVDAFVAHVDDEYDESFEPERSGLGSALYDWLDGPERWLARAGQEPGGVALHIDTTERLRHLPWELLMRDGAWLCGNQTRFFTPVRRVGSAARHAAPANRPLRVLFMASSPEDIAPVLAYEQEEGRILEATGRWTTDLIVEESGTLTGLADTLRAYETGHFDVVHVVGHAGVDEDVPSFILEDQLGRAEWVSAGRLAAELAEAVGGDWPRLIFVSGCSTGQAPRSGDIASLAESLVAAGAPAVLGWSLPVEDEIAAVAAAELYERLASGARIDEAVAATRRVLLQRRGSGWHLLRLYSDATPLAPLVTKLKTPGRARQRTRPAATQFLDAGRLVGKVAVCSRESFVGRRRSIQRCLRILRSVEGDEEHAEGVLLHGMGGLGKSSLAARLCERMDDLPRLVWVGLVDEIAFVHTLVDGTALPGVAEILNESRLTLKQRLIRCFDGPLAAPCLFVFDDFEHALELDPEGRPVLGGDDRARARPEAHAVLTALLDAIRHTGSASRVIVTSRYRIALRGLARLHEEPLERLRGADLEKKAAQLPELERLRSSDPELAERALSASAGNPRLLEWVDRAFRGEADGVALIEAIERTEERFREDILVRELLGQQEKALRRMLALLSVYDLPVPDGAARAVAGEDFDRLRERAVALGVVEQGTAPGTGQLRYYVSPIIRSHVRGEVTPDELVEACQRGARHLSETFSESPGDERALEVIRLALEADERNLYMPAAFVTANRWLHLARFYEAAQLCSRILAYDDDLRLLHLLAQATAELGDETAAEAHYRRAISLTGTPSDHELARARADLLYNFSTLLYRTGKTAEANRFLDDATYAHKKAKDHHGIAVCLHAKALQLDNQGHATKALALAKESLRLHRQLGEKRGEAASQHLIGSILLKKQDWRAGMEALATALDLYQTVPDPQGYGQTLCRVAMGWLLQKDSRRAQKTARHALQIARHINDPRMAEEAIVVLRLAG